jgi:hypothetical protein
MSALATTASRTLLPAAAAHFSMRMYRSPVFGGANPLRAVMLANNVEAAFVRAYAIALQTMSTASPNDTVPTGR